MPLSEELLKILACPQCRGDLILTGEGDGLICKDCELLYPVEDDIPILLKEEAKPMERGGQPPSGTRKG